MLISKEYALAQAASEFLIARLKLQVPEADHNDILAVMENHDASLATSNEASLGNIFFRLITSAQNAHMKAGVVGKAIGGLENIKPYLYDCDLKKILHVYPAGSAIDLNGSAIKLLDYLQVTLLKGKDIREERQSIWPSFAKSILTAARFLNEFKDAKEFFNWVSSFANDDKQIDALPFIISQEVHGIGYALACDFLKELGFKKFAKPDVHLKEVLKALGFIDANTNDYKCMKEIRRIAKECNLTSYALDKRLWLCGSGKFYHYEVNGTRASIKPFSDFGGDTSCLKIAGVNKRLRDEFIDYAKEKRKFSSNRQVNTA